MYCDPEREEAFAHPPDGDLSIGDNIHFILHKVARDELFRHQQPEKIGQCRRQIEQQPEARLVLIQRAHQLTHPRLQDHVLAFYCLFAHSCILA